MAEKLDKKDYRILYELDKNARQPLSNIARKVNLSRESVLYRINKYKESGILRNFLTVVNVSKLGFSHYKIFNKLHNITEAEEKELIQGLSKNPFVPWIASCDGTFSLVFGIKARNLVELNTIIQDINNKYGKYFLEQTITSIISAHHFYRDYLIGKSGTTERKIMWGGKEETTKLDNINIEILDALSKDARATAVEIASKLKISPDSVLQRIKKLENSGILEHYMIWPNVNKLKGIYYKVLIKLKSLSEEKEKKLVLYCLNNPNIIYVVNSLGPWQLEMDIEVENIEEFRKVMREFLNEFSDTISDYTPLNIYEEYKFLFFEKKVLES